MKQVLKVKDLMAVTGWSQSHAAKVLNKIRVEYNKQFPKQVTVEDVSKYLGISEAAIHSSISGKK